MKIELDALDTLFFRDGKPFTMQEETWADILFPPHPSTFYGALRSAWFANNPAELGKAETAQDETKKLQITGTHLFRDDSIFYSMPRDLVIPKEETDSDHALATPMQLQDITAHSSLAVSSLLPSLLFPEDEEKTYESPETGLMNRSDFERYLHGDMDALTAFNLSELISKDPKIGISRLGQMRTTAQGALYRIDMVRLEAKGGDFNSRLKFYLDFEGIDLPDEGFLKLGGEGKAVRYKKITSPAEPLAPANLSASNMFKIVLLTPAFFRQGWLPDFIAPDSLSYKVDGCFQLVAASLGKKMNIGGFDMKAKFPKPMLAAVPAGSVYYFKTNAEMDDEFAEKIIELFHNGNIMTENSEFQLFQKQGFGLSVVGGV